jgi:ATP-binding cassette subfamily C (CFTR/MRP) protein 1
LTLRQVEGVTTIRAFGWQQEVEADHIQHLDNSQQPYYIYFCVQRWLTLVLDLLVAVVSVLVVALAVFFSSTTTGGQVGVALNMVIATNNTLVKLVESYTDLEISLGAISRIKSLEEDVPSEAQPGETEVPPEDWPFLGKVEIEDVTVSYK